MSHQVKILEQSLGLAAVPPRRPAALSSSKTGHLYYPTVRDAFDQIETQTRLLRPGKADNELTIQVYVTVALKWLIPRLHDFERRFPDMKVRLSTAYFDWDFDESQCRLRLHPGPQQIAPAHYYRTLFPLAAHARLRAGTAEAARMP